MYSQRFIYFIFGCIKIVILFGALTLPFLSIAQPSSAYAVQVSASVSNNPPSIKLEWPFDVSANNYNVYRKTKESGFWGLPDTILPGTATFYMDDSVKVGEAYEYKIWKSASGYNGYGYIYAGIEAPAYEDRGKVILVIDSTYAIPLAAEITRLEEDLHGDGWHVIKLYVLRNDSVHVVKARILDAFKTDSINVKAVFLLGHVPVPYSGNIAPDGHVPDHLGAWPADVYYGDIDGIWTDVSVNNTAATRPQNRNVPFDGKFDQSLIASNIELQVGRVDMYDMPAFAESDTELLRQYLDKDHDFRHQLITAEHRALIDDNFFGFFGEAFASSGWRNFATMFGSTNVSSTLDYFPTLDSASYLWSYGCGGGSYTSASGIGNTAQFASTPVKSVFTVLFGSYFGDWDTQNNFLRAPLASKTHCLTNFWAGRPHWAFHHMALGENIGYSTRLTQNNSFLYTANFGGRSIHVALMGDPTLKMHIVGPPAMLNTDSINSTPHVKLTWNASQDSVLGYYIYRESDTAGPFTRISAEIVMDTSFIDSMPLNGMNRYMVRAIKLELSGSGTYYNLSQGIFNTTTRVITGISTLKQMNDQLFVYPSPTDGKFYIELESKTNFRGHIFVYDIKGSMVYSEHITLNNSKLYKEIDLTSMAKGIYFVRVHSGKKRFSYKVLID